MTLTPEERGLLIHIARTAIAAEVDGEPRPALAPGEGGLARKTGVFVSLHERATGALRGCIGTFASEWPLPLTVQEMACAAAVRDPRFPPVAPEELPELTIEISVLSPPERIDNPEAIEIGRHGVFLVNGVHRGVLLPQVAVDNAWDRTTFLENTCLKAGLDMNAWREHDTAIHVFTAEIFDETDPDVLLPESGADAL